MDAVLTCDVDVSPGLRRTLEQIIRDGLIASAVYKRATRSTNSDAIDDLQSGRIDDTMLPRLYLADSQTAGRGRHGKSWVSKHDALTFSLVVDIDLSHPGTSLLSPAVGVAVARAIEFSCAPCRVALKWPNDICALSSDQSTGAPELRKLGGVLIEAAASVRRRSVIGIGLNINGKPQLVDPNATPPTSLADLCSRTISREDLLSSIAESLLETLADLASESIDILSQYRSRCALIGNDLSLKHGNEVITGQCTGIDDEGSLELVVDGHRRFFRSGEVARVRGL